MPARETRFRALTDDFRRHFNERRCWPARKQVRARVDISNGDFALMRKGDEVPEKLIFALAATLLNGPALTGYLNDRGIAEPGGLTVFEIVEHIATPLNVRPDPRFEEPDLHMKGLDALVELFTRYFWGKVVKPGMLCGEKDDVRAAVSLLMASIGRGASNDALLPNTEAIRAAESHMGISEDNYLKRVIGLSKVAPWAIAFAMADGQRVGASVVLPLAESAYEAIRLGERHSNSIMATDLVLPSQTLFLEAIGHRSDAEYSRVRRKTGLVVKTIYVQLAQLSLCADAAIQNETGLRVLSLAGNAKNAKRLQNSGFRPTGTTMPNSHVSLMEMDSSIAWLTPSIVRGIQKRLRSDSKVE